MPVFEARENNISTDNEKIGWATLYKLLFPRVIYMNFNVFSTLGVPSMHNDFQALIV